MKNWLKRGAIIAVALATMGVGLTATPAFADTSTTVTTNDTISALDHSGATQTAKNVHSTDAGGVVTATANGVTTTTTNSAVTMAKGNTKITMHLPTNDTRKHATRGGVVVTDGTNNTGNAVQTNTDGSTQAFTVIKNKRAAERWQLSWPPRAASGSPTRRVHETGAYTSGCPTSRRGSCSRTSRSAETMRASRVTRLALAKNFYLRHS